MPLFNRIFSRDFVVARRLEHAAREKQFVSNMLFSKEFILRMIDYGGITASSKPGEKISLTLKNGSKIVFVRYPVSGIKTVRIREKLIECRVNEIYELNKA